MTSLFQQIDELIPTLPGWGDAEKSKTLAAMVMAMHPKVSVEIGVYGGRTFFGLALAHKFIGEGVVIGIDPWSNIAAIEGYDGENRKFWANNPLNKIHDDFMEKVFELSCRNVVKIERKKSDDAEVPKRIDILHIDGQHTEQAVKDVKRFAPFVRIGGIAVMDDTQWKNGDDAPVARAVDELLSLGFKPLYKLGTGEAFQRVSQ